MSKIPFHLTGALIKRAHKKKQNNEVIKVADALKPDILSYLRYP